ncbi:carbon-nitrogen family hydrolase [uncultured Mitsuokella sp.]|uniref:carbon-nitrogen family hydrolase n=1 Tax=uncultured Mitsuokella sp. TaxID=453120 RepID=UPI00263A24BA|nr:carbon-nitrogen family hydrolase [uncultured Mitsuokella sp.]
MKVSILQMPVAFGRPEANIATLKAMAKDAMRDKPDVLVLPELWRLGFYPKPIAPLADRDGREARQTLALLAAHYGVNIVGGTVANVATDKEGPKVYNTCFVYDRLGDLVTRYDKVHLFSPSGETKDFQAGSQLVTCELDGVKCGLAICYDLRFPEFIQKLALSGIDILFLPAAWPESRLTHWRVLTRARAIENQMFVVAANEAGTDEQGNHLAGHSAIIDPWGEILAEADTEQSILTANLRPVLCRHIRQDIPVRADRRPELYTTHQ